MYVHPDGKASLDTLTGWAAWITLVFLMNAAAFVLAVGVPIFNFLIGIAASLFASWYTVRKDHQYD